ncbi:hypothetical protein G0Z01_03700, partial [Staphylococcus aureus]|nr:hypothetical protein [Staphylococcus aureus]
MRTNHIRPTKSVKAHIYGNTLELGTGLGNVTPPIRLSATEYMTRDGKRRTYKTHSKNRSENLMSLKKSLKRLRRLIGNNFFGKSNELWVTLTYKENVTDTKKVYKDYKAFMKKIRRAYGKEIEYINVLEPQKRGAWHMHVLFKHTELDELYIPHDVLEKKWGHGYVFVKRLRESDNVAAYVTAYLTNLDVTGTSMASDNDVYVSNNGKSFKKGARLEMYPRDMKFYRISNGIKQPISCTMSKEEILKKYTPLRNNFYLPDSYSTYDIKLDNGRIFELEKEFYKLHDLIEREGENMRVMKIRKANANELYNKTSLAEQLTVSVRTLDRYVIDEVIESKAQLV